MHDATFNTQYYVGTFDPSTNGDTDDDLNDVH